MTREEFVELWQAQGICPCKDCTEKAYDLIRDLLAGAREKIADHLDDTHPESAAYVRMMTVDGIGNKGLDLWPRHLAPGTLLGRRLRWHWYGTPGRPQVFGDGRILEQCRVSLNWVMAWDSRTGELAWVDLRWPYTEFLD